MGLRAGLLSFSLFIASASAVAAARPPCPVLLGAPGFSAESLRDSYAIVPAKPVFSTLSGHWLSLKYAAGGFFGVADSYDAVSLKGPDALRRFIGEGNFERLQVYAAEMRALLQSRFPGELVRFQVTLSAENRRDIRLVVDQRGRLVSGGHRHVPPVGEGFIDITVAKAELGPATVLLDAQGRPFSDGQGSAVIFTDAWHASPASTDPRFVIFIDARFVSPVYIGYYAERRLLEKP